MNAPQRMCCTRCKKQAKLQQANMIPKEKSFMNDRLVKLKLFLKDMKPRKIKKENCIAKRKK